MYAIKLATNLLKNLTYKPVYPIISELFRKKAQT